MEWQEVLGEVNSAIDRVWIDDADLFRIAVHERTIAHRLALQLEGRFGELSVDCEYNKAERDTKMVRSPQLRALLMTASQNPDVRVFPDIVIHSRGTSSSNLLALELKLVREGDPLDFADEIDDVKLETYLSPSGLGYEYAAAVLLPVGRSYESGHRALVRRTRSRSH